jgi:hypothetical protein
MTARLSTCLACGARIAPALTAGASLRCHDCRDSHAPLRADLVDGRAVVLRFVPRSARPWRKAA